MFEVPDPAWAEYERDRNSEALTTKRSLFRRAIFAPSLASALSPKTAQNGRRAGIFADQLEYRLKRRLASHAAPMNTFLQVMLFAKTI
jgi:hypothetical protein